MAPSQVPANSAPPHPAPISQPRLCAAAGGWPWESTVELGLRDVPLGLRLTVEAWHGVVINFEVGEFGALTSAVSKCPSLQVMSLLL